MSDPEYRPSETLTGQWVALHIYRDEKVRRSGVLVLTSERLIWQPGGLGRWRTSRPWECDLAAIRDIEAFHIDMAEWLVIVDCPDREGFIMAQPDSLLHMVRQAIGAG